MSRSDTGAELSAMRDPLRNKGLAFTASERETLGLRGFLPPAINDMAAQVARELAHLRSKPNAMEKYEFLMDLLDRDETLFFRLVLDNLTEIMPLVYTPTVGEACQKYGKIFRRPRGLFISLEDRGHVAEILARWPNEVRAIVFTDGERILGLGDLGAHGMGIPVGKLALYVACAGVPPSQCLPVTLDVGTNNEALRHDPLYLGLRRPRARGEEYDALVREFIEAAVGRFGRSVLLQFEDFGNSNAFRLLQEYRDKVCTFNDDIQGTAAVTLAGLFAAARVTGREVDQQTYLMHGAGEAGVGIADLLASAIMERSGCSVGEARGRIWMVDSKGLVVTSRRAELAHHKLNYAHEGERAPDLISSVRQVRPSVLIGVSAQAGAFTQEVLEEMASLNERPIIFALSNPTSKSECTAEQAYRCTHGSALFASGSPFDPVELAGKRHVPGQGNNSYIFPGVALGTILARATRVTDHMFLAAARALADQVAESDLEHGCLYPPLRRIRDVSASIAAAVIELALEDGTADLHPRPADLVAFCTSRMYVPEYAAALPSRL